MSQKFLMIAVSSVLLSIFAVTSVQAAEQENKSYVTSSSGKAVTSHSSCVYSNGANGDLIEDCTAAPAPAPVAYVAPAPVKMAPVKMAAPKQKIIYVYK